jgi:multisubunit Na+/H+ antiporter MnhB subunit
MRKLFLSVSGVFGAVPGFAIMWKGIWTPPGYSFLFGGVIEALGSLALILLWMNRAKIKAIRPRRIIKSAIALAVASFVALIVYLALFNLCVISHPTHHLVFFPLWTSGELASLVTKAGGRWNALDTYGYFGVYGATQKMPFYALPLTAAALLFFYQSIFTTLTIAFGLVGYHEGEDIKMQNKEPASSPGKSKGKSKRSC